MDTSLLQVAIKITKFAIGNLHVDWLDKIDLTVQSDH